MSQTNVIFTGEVKAKFLGRNGDGNSAKKTALELALAQVEKARIEDAWGEYPSHTRNEWADAVANRDTQLGYWEWVESTVESES